MAWVEPLELQTWLITIFSGTPYVFGAVALIAIAGIAGFFRMATLTMFFLMGIFVLMFSGTLPIDFMLMFGIIGGLMIGYWLSRMFSR